MKHFPMILAAIVALLSACEPDRAPYAPECEDCPDDPRSYVDASCATSPPNTKLVHPELPGVEPAPVSTDKHNNAVHIMSQGNIDRTLWANYSLQTDTCQNGQGCFLQNGAWYTSQWVDANTSNMWRSLVSVEVLFGWDGLGSAALPAGTIWICENQVDNCIDLSPRGFFFTNFAGRQVRRYSVSMGGVWLEYRVWTVWVRPQGGTFPKVNPEGSILQFSYRHPGL